MTYFAATGSATPVDQNTRPSLIGFPQRHYQLSPVLEAPDGQCSCDVVVVAGVRGTYAYLSTDSGEISDFTALLKADAGTGDEAVLARLGYRVVTADVLLVAVGGPAA